MSGAYKIAFGKSINPFGPAIISPFELVTFSVPLSVGASLEAVIVFVVIIAFSLLQPSNISYPSSLLNLSPIIIDSKFSQRSNILLTSTPSTVPLILLYVSPSKLDVSKLLKSIFFKLLQALNINPIVFTLLVSNPLTSKLVNLLQPENIPSILVTFVVLKLFTSKLVN